MTILSDVKHTLGVTLDYTAFDTEIIIAINSAMMVAEQLGLPPFRVLTGEETWVEYFDPLPCSLDAVKSYISLRARLIFDPPNNSFLTSAIEKQIEECGWRIAFQIEANT